jgi:hypothetical protein
VRRYMKTNHVVSPLEIEKDAQAVGNAVHDRGRYGPILARKACDGHSPNILALDIADGR